MPFGHFRGGLKRPLRCDGGFTVNGFISPVDGLPHGRSHKPFGICSCEKCACNCLAICSYKSLDLKSIRINTYKKQWGGVPPFPLLAMSLSARERVRARGLLSAEL